ncbi:LAMI_0F02960g1_1 [Lachancea mirantina]|uniref:LAMI_0F02960g1_1 n=1 Tax=Lachancea mirantina TaxID=1230905 RepID=A0A1G4JWU5_9SACH|nr:LAMI_0F02960g1_1 [Lachancea mirantina]
MSRFEADLEKSIKKACSIEETSPKRKHVRACIVYTWDHKSGRSFFNALKVQPFAQDEVQLFKALITMHKVLQEGHPSVLVEAIRNRDWVESLGRIYAGGSGDGYGRIINEYVNFLVRKLDFHSSHRGFNGTFEYEEYLSLMATSNPDEGYETILDLMDLQDHLDYFSQVLFASISGARVKECKVSALVPLVAESYGIYKFVTSMLRAMVKQTGEEGAMAPLMERYGRQHFRLFEFYADCSSIKFLTSLIKIPKLPTECPSLMESEEGLTSKGPSNVDFRDRSKSASENRDTPPLVPRVITGGNVSSVPPQITGLGLVAAPVVNAMPTGMPMVDFQAQIEQEQARLLAAQRERDAYLQQEHERQLAFQEEQEAMERERQAQLQRQHQEQVAFEEGLRMQQAQNMKLFEQQQVQSDLNALCAQHDRDQVLLQQYDDRVSSLEEELERLNVNVENQLQSKDEQMRGLEEWKDKYEALARLYAQLRQEHLQVLKKLKKVQIQAGSAIEERKKAETKDLMINDYVKKNDVLRKRLDEMVVKLDAKEERGALKRVVELIESLLYGAIYGLDQDWGSGSFYDMASDKATEFALSFTNYVVEGESLDVDGFINNMFGFVCAVAALGNENAAFQVSAFLGELLPEYLRGNDEEKTDKVIDLNVKLQRHLSIMKDMEPALKRIMPFVGGDKSGTVEAILNLIKASIECQKEIGSEIPNEFYKKENRWRDGLISAAKAISVATETMLIADSYERFKVASNEVVASTAQLVAACRVKNPPSQAKLEQCSRIVSSAVKKLVQKPNEAPFTEPLKEMDQQVEIVRLENALEEARKRLGDIRKQSYT